MTFYFIFAPEPLELYVFVKKPALSNLIILDIEHIFLVFLF